MIFLLPFFLLPFFLFPTIFSNTSSFPRQAVQTSFWAEEVTNYCYQQMKEEEGRRNAVVEAFQVAEKSNQDLKKRLLE